MFVGAAILVLGLQVLLPGLGVGDRAALQNQQIAFLSRWLDASLDLRVLSPFDFDFSIDRSEELGLGLDLDTRDHERGPSFDLARKSGHGARFQVGLHLDLLGRVQGSLNLALDTDGHRSAHGDRERDTHSGRDLQVDIVQLGDGGVVDGQTALQFLGEVSEFGWSFLEPLLHEFFAHWQDGDGLRLEHGREVGFGFVLVFVFVLTMANLQVFREDVVQFAFVFVLTVLDIARMAADEVTQRVGQGGR